MEWKGKIRSKVPEWAGRAHPPLVRSCSPSSCPSLSLQPFALVVVAPGVGWSGEGRHGARCKSGLLVVVTVGGLWLRLRAVGVGRGYLRDVCIRAHCWLGDVPYCGIAIYNIHSARCHPPRLRPGEASVSLCYSRADSKWTATDRIGSWTR